MDSLLEDGSECRPWEVAYAPGSGSGTDLVDSCSTLNAGNACATRACIVELNFVENLLAHFVAGGIVDFANFGHERPGSFDAVSGCQVIPGLKGTEKSCCGSYRK